MNRGKRGQRGFTLVELLVAIPIAALVMLAAGAVIVQLVHSERASSHMTVIRQLQQAGTWVSKDGLQAETVSLASGNGFPCTLEWYDHTAPGAPKHTVVYSLVPMGYGSLYQLERQETVEGSTSTTTTTVAKNLVGANNATALSWTDYAQSAFRLQVASNIGSTTDNKTYDVTPRPTAKPW